MKPCIPQGFTFMRKYAKVLRELLCPDQRHVQEKGSVWGVNQIREWISDNLRYILLGAAAILLILIVVLAVRGIAGRKNTNETPQTQSQEQAGNVEGQEGQTEKTTEKTAVTPVQTEAAAPGEGLVKNDTPVLDVISRYYRAWAEKDFETLRIIDPALSAEDEADIQNNDAIESFNNIETYSVEGLTAQSYMAYVYFDVKLAGITTLAPTLTDFYLAPDENGNLVIVDKYSTQELADFTESMRTQPGVQALIRQVDSKLADAENQDEDLKEYILSLRGNSGQEDGSGENTGTGAFSEGDEVTATTIVNVRSQASTNGTIYGSLTPGVSATVIESQEDGWTKIRYVNSGVTIEGFVMTQYLTSAQ